MMARFPLFIQGPVFLVFAKMANGDKKKREKERQGARVRVDADLVQSVKGRRLSCLSEANASSG